MVEYVVRIPTGKFIIFCSWYDGE